MKFPIGRLSLPAALLVAVSGAGAVNHVPMESGQIADAHAGSSTTRPDAGSAAAAKSIGSTCSAGSSMSDCRVFGDNFDRADACHLVKQQIADTTQRGLFQPDGYEGIEVPWDVVFSPPARGSLYHFPATSSAPYPVGSETLGGVSNKGMYMIIPFVADEMPSPISKHKLEWYKAVASSSFNWYRPHPANGVFVTISPCMGDFRTSTAITWPEGDETLNRFCRIFHQELNMYFGANGSCPTVPGRQYYLNLVFADPTGGLDPAESSCDPQGWEFVDGRCDIMMQMRN